MQQGKSWIGIIVLVLVIVGAFLLFSYKKTPYATTPSGTVNVNNLAELPIFADGLQAVGIEADEIGFHDFSPSGRYFMFNVFKETPGAPGNSGYVLDTKTGDVRKLPGMPERGIEDDRVIQLYTQGGMTLFWLESGESKSYPIGENIFLGSLSPNGKRYTVNTADGVKIVNIETGEVSSLSDERYDGAYVWFKDSTRTLGYQATDETLFEAGNARIPGIWNTVENTFTPLSITLPQKTLRMVTWVIPDRVARYNAGYDDGSFDYLVDVTTNKIAEIGETSGALMGGIKEDPERGLFAVIGGDDLSASGSRAVIYRGLEKLYEKQSLAKGYFRENMHIISDHELLYIRKHLNQSGSVDSVQLVSFDFKIGAEQVIRELPLKTFTSLSLAPDHTTFVIGSSNEFLVGKIK